MTLFLLWIICLTGEFKTRQEIIRGNWVTAAANGTYKEKYSNKCNFMGFAKQISEEATCIVRLTGTK